MTRLAYICADPGVPVFGAKGCSIHVREVIRAMRRAGLAVELFAARLDGPVSDDLADLPIHVLPRRCEPDAVNSALFESLTRMGSFEFVFERYSLWSEAGMEYASELGIPGLLEVNAPLIEEAVRHRGLTLRCEAEAAAVRIFHRASGIVAVSDEVNSYLMEFPEAVGKIIVEPNGVDPDRFAKRSNRDGCEPFTVGFVGSLKPWHGLSILIDAFAQFHDLQPHSRLLIVGDGPERDNLNQQLSARNLQAAAILTGALRHEQIPRCIAAMDAAVAPYPNNGLHYFSPLKLFEYMASRRAIVASRIGQVSNVIQHNVNGLLVSPGNPNELTQAFIRLHRDPELRKQLGRNARRHVIKHHTWEGVVRRIFQFAMRSASLEV